MPGKPKYFRSPTPPRGSSAAARLGKIFWLALGLAFSAASAPAAQPRPLPAWPAPPQAPCIVYVRDFAGPRDIGARLPFLTRLLDTVTGTGGDARKLDRPFGLSLDAAGNLLVTDTGANAVCYFDLARKQWSSWQSVGQRRFLSPVAAVRHGPTFFVADSALGEVLAFDARGRLQFEITNHLERPTGLALLGDQLLVVDSQLHQVVVCGLRGEFVSCFGRRGRGDGEFNFPTHIAVDAHNHIYVTDSLNHRVQVFAADGKFVRAFGSAGDGPGHFSRPKGVAVDTAGHIYVVDAVFGNVQIFNAAGQLLLDFGRAGSGPGEFWLPNAIAIDARNDIFVSDAYNHRVQMFRYTGRE